MSKDGRSKARNIRCRWCGEVATVHSHKALFCSEKCNTAFNRLRTKRGAAMYDMIMSGRFEREKFPHYLTSVSQLAREYRDEDKAERDGRKSWVTQSDLL
jgi:hypothetical protein